MIYQFDISIKKKLTQIVFGWLILVVLYQFCNSLLLSQLEGPVLMRVDMDPVYWLLQLTGLGEVLVSNQGISIFFDTLLFVSLITAIVYPQKQFLRITASVLFSVYVLTINTYMCWHYHNLIPLLLLLIPFCVESVRNFSIWFAGLRYMVLFIYASAALWKLFRGSVFNPGQMKWMIEFNYMDRLSQDGYMLSSFESGIVNLLDYPGIADALLILGVFMEAIFIIGFFTKRFDFLLLIVGVVFHLCTTILVEVSFIQLWILFIVFVPNLPWNVFSLLSEKSK